ncbi:unnamed protein product [Brassicogethes aeneus]|uniref:Uncharacterized protein n=1 Tax=Brassicogethes aeneus TaxID=1431903 RepID=A0A9P0AP56_BRAAE|nr:unnamed protein product [Brassicogethes aeneus]
MVTKENLSNVIDKNKVRRAREKARSLLSKAHTDSKVFIKSIYFDDRKEYIISREKRWAISPQKDFRRAYFHNTIIEEPESVYMSLVSGTGKSIAVSIYEFCVKNNISFDQIDYDGTGVNTGCKNGVRRYLELQIKIPLQWFICQLHANELPFRHLFEHLDGRTTGPSQYMGSIEKSLENCEVRSVVDFIPVIGFLPEVNSDDLSTYQRYLNKICQAVSFGQYPQNIANSQPGKISHARWLTKANRILRFYMSCEKPSQNLIITYC